MNIYLITGWSVVPGDRAYVEAETATDALAHLSADLVERDDNDDERPPQSSWQVEQLDRPMCIVIYRD